MIVTDMAVAAMATERASMGVTGRFHRCKLRQTTSNIHDMSLHTYLLFLPACFALNMAFGPNNVLSLSNGARNGVLHSVTASFGRLAAFAIMIAITGFGMGALLLASETLFLVLKFGGAAYLVWLGIKLLRSKSTEQPVVETERRRPGRTGRICW